MTSPFSFFIYQASVFNDGLVSLGASEKAVGCVAERVEMRRSELDAQIMDSLHEVSTHKKRKRKMMLEKRRHIEFAHFEVCHFLTARQHVTRPMATILNIASRSSGLERHCSPNDLAVRSFPMPYTCRQH